MEPGTSQKLALSSWPFSELWGHWTRFSLSCVSSCLLLILCHLSPPQGPSWIWLPCQCMTDKVVISQNDSTCLYDFSSCSHVPPNLRHHTQRLPSSAWGGGGPGGFLPGISLDPIDLPENCLNTRVHSQLFPPFPLGASFLDTLFLNCLLLYISSRCLQKSWVTWSQNLAS